MEKEKERRKESPAGAIKYSTSIGNRREKEAPARDKSQRSIFEFHPLDNLVHSLRAPPLGPRA
jgi:hypothetical protein